jgi:hypothetical protein
MVATRLKKHLRSRALCCLLSAAEGFALRSLLPGLVQLLDGDAVA